MLPPISILPSCLPTPLATILKPAQHSPFFTDSIYFYAVLKQLGICHPSSQLANIGGLPWIQGQPRLKTDHILRKRKPLNWFELLSLFKEYLCTSLLRLLSTPFYWHYLPELFPYGPSFIASHVYMGLVYTLLIEAGSFPRHCWLINLLFLSFCISTLSLGGTSP